MADFASDVLSPVTDFGLYEMLMSWANRAPFRFLKRVFPKERCAMSKLSRCNVPSNLMRNSVMCATYYVTEATTSFHPLTTLLKNRSSDILNSNCDSVKLKPSAGSSVTTASIGSTSKRRALPTKLCKVPHTGTFNSCSSIRAALAIVIAAFGLAVATGSGTDDQMSLITRMTTEGRVKGYLHRLAHGRGVSERFLGIPFASPPVGSRRFQRPSPAPKRDSTLEALELPPACMQTAHDASYIRDYRPTYDGRMDEDCLYLNIYLSHSAQTQRSTSSRDNLLPVLVHIHGGSNEAGSSFMFQPDALAVLGNMVVVTVNYRLGALGFLSAPHIGIHGNMGLWDQTMALEWLKDNIENFGGDPAKVTLQGHSAGAVNVGLHLISPVSKGLFRFVILQSGSPLAAWAVLPTLPVGKSDRGPTQHLEAIGCSETSQNSDTLTCLQTMDVLKIVNAHYKHAPNYYRWSATVDGQFLPDNPTRMVDSCRFNINVHTLMIGLVKDEGSLTAEAMAKTYMFLQRHNRPPTVEDFVLDRTHVTDPPILKESDFDVHVDGYRDIPNIQELTSYTYFPWHDPSNKIQVIKALTDYLGDITFVAPAVQFLEKITALETAKSFMYVIDHRSLLSRFPPWMGSTHGEDLAYVFGCPLDGQCGRNFTELDIELSLAMIRMWSSFVHTGSPSVPGTLQNPVPYQSNREYISISTNDIGEESNKTECGKDMSDIKANATSVSPPQLLYFSIKRRFRARYMKFWNSLLPSFRISSVNNITTVSGKYRVATLTLTTSLVAVTFALVVVSSILVHVLRKQKTSEVKKQELSGADKSLL